MSRVMWTISLVLAATNPAMAECPSAKSPLSPFTVGVGGSSTSEVYRMESGETRLVGRFSNNAVVEQTYYQGLIQLEHIDRGNRTLYTPKSDLKKLFPPRVGQTYTVDFEMLASNGQKRPFRGQYKVVGRDRIAIGGCPYEVLKIEHSNVIGEGQLHFINTDWYAPEIKLILAREYKRPGGGSDIRKYDSIAPLKKDQPRQPAPTGGRSI